MSTAMPMLSFSEEDLRAIAHDRYHYPDPRVQQKMEVEPAHGGLGLVKSR